MKTIINVRNKTITMMPNDVRPALCLDLDGTVRYAKGGGRFIQGPEDIALFPGVEEKLWEYRNKGYLIFGISNQGGVAYGFKTPQDNDAEIEATCNLFYHNPFHIIKTCLHHPDGTVAPYNYRSLLRKPDIGMLALCEVDAWEAGYIVDWTKSLFVGDRLEDQEAAFRASINFEWAWAFFGRPKPEGE